MRKRHLQEKRHLQSRRFSSESTTARRTALARISTARSALTPERRRASHQSDPLKNAVRPASNTSSAESAYVKAYSQTVLAGLASALFSIGCGEALTESRPEVEAGRAINEIAAELIASDSSWGNTEGPAVDSNGNLYFTSRGTYKGIVSWNAADGPRQHAAVATMAGPGGLWVDENDNIFLTATLERKILKLAPDKSVSVVAENFEVLSPDISTGPNDLVVAKDGTVYFTVPNGYFGESPNGTVYRTTPGGTTSVFSDEITGPNGVVLSADEKTLFVAHNISESVAKIERWPLNEDGSAGGIAEVATVNDCVGDGMAVDRQDGIWITCYGFGTAYRVTPDGEFTDKITTEQKALTNAVFGRGAANTTLYLSSSDMERVTGYVYRANVTVPGLR